MLVHGDIAGRRMVRMLVHGRESVRVQYEYSVNFKQPVCQSSLMRLLNDCTTVMPFFIVPPFSFIFSPSRGVSSCSVMSAV
jgi:hypothetical protein